MVRCGTVLQLTYYRIDFVYKYDPPREVAETPRQLGRHHLHYKRKIVSCKVTITKI